MSEGGKTARSDLWGGAGWVGFGLLILGESLRMDRFTSMGANLYTMPGFVPGLIGSLIVLLGAVLMGRGWRRSRRMSADDSANAAVPLLNRRIVFTLVLSLVYAGALLGRAPFWLCTAAFVSAFTWLFTPDDVPPRRRLLTAVLAGGISATVVLVVFQHVFLVRLP